MKSNWRFSAGLLLLVSLGVLGCETSTREMVGTETNWLMACDRDAECGEFSCLCGVCTTACTPDEECPESDSVCRAVDEAPADDLCVSPSALPGSGGICLRQGCSGVDCIASEPVMNASRGGAASGGTSGGDDTGGGGGAGGSGGSGTSGGSAAGEDGSGGQTAAGGNADGGTGTDPAAGTGCRETADCDESRVCLGPYELNCTDEACALTACEVGDASQSCVSDTDCEGETTATLCNAVCHVCVEPCASETQCAALAPSKDLSCASDGRCVARQCEGDGCSPNFTCQATTTTSSNPETFYACVPTPCAADDECVDGAVCVARSGGNTRYCASALGECVADPTQTPSEACMVDGCRPEVCDEVGERCCDPSPGDGTNYCNGGLSCVADACVDNDTPPTGPACGSVVCQEGDRCCDSCLGSCVSELSGANCPNEAVPPEECPSGDACLAELQVGCARLTGASTPCCDGTVCCGGVPYDQDGECRADGCMFDSDRNIKHGVRPVDGPAVLETLSTLPLNYWSYNRDPGVSHVGPMAQDFRAAFQLGASDTRIDAVDGLGVALTAIQALNQKVERLSAELDQLRDECAAVAPSSFSRNYATTTGASRR